MRKTMILAAGAGLLLACRGSEREAETPADESGGAVSIAVPNAPSPVDSPPDVSPAPAMEPGDSMVTGTVRETGAMPLAQIVIQPAETPVAVHGDLRDEIGNLIGAEVRVWGPVVDNQPPPPPRAIDVRGYEVLSVGGSAPIVGNLIEEGGRLFLVSGTRVELATIPDALRSHIGAKVWIVGVRQGETVSVQSFGVIRN